MEKLGHSNVAFNLRFFQVSCMFESSPNKILIGKDLLPTHTVGH